MLSSPFKVETKTETVNEYWKVAFKNKVGGITFLDFKQDYNYNIQNSMVQA